MTFDEWADSREANEMPVTPQPYIGVRDIARRAWEAATKVERERCAKIAENYLPVPQPVSRPIQRHIASQIRQGA